MAEYRSRNYDPRQIAHRYIKRPYGYGQGDPYLIEEVDAAGFTIRAYKTDGADVDPAVLAKADELHRNRQAYNAVELP